MVAASVVLAAPFCDQYQRKRRRPRLRSTRVTVTMTVTRDKGERENYTTTTKTTRASFYGECTRNDVNIHMYVSYIHLCVCMYVCVCVCPNGVDAAPGAVARGAKRGTLPGDGSCLLPRGVHRPPARASLPCACTVPANNPSSVSFGFSARVASRRGKRERPRPVLLSSVLVIENAKCFNTQYTLTAGSLTCTGRDVNCTRAFTKTRAARHTTEIVTCDTNLNFPEISPSVI